MATGRDIAQFVSQMTGKNFTALYDESQIEEERMMEQKQKFQNGFNSMMNRIDETEKKNKREIID